MSECKLTVCSTFQSEFKVARDQGRFEKYFVEWKRLLQNHVPQYNL